MGVLPHLSFFFIMYTVKKNVCLLCFVPKINLKKSIKRVVCNIEMKYLIFVQVFDKQGGKTQA